MSVADLRYHQTGQEEVLSVSKQTPAVVRRAVERTLHGWGLASGDVETAQVIISELVTNAIVHAKVRDVRYRIEHDGLRVLLAVWDTSPKDPVKSDPEDESESGRGLQMIDALSDQWGIDRKGYPHRGKWVWAALNGHTTESCPPPRSSDD